MKRRDPQAPEWLCGAVHELDAVCPYCAADMRVDARDGVRVRCGECGGWSGVVVESSGAYLASFDDPADAEAP